MPTKPVDSRMDKSPEPAYKNPGPPYKMPEIVGPSGSKGKRTESKYHHAHVDVEKDMCINIVAT